MATTKKLVVKDVNGQQAYVVDPALYAKGAAIKGVDGDVVEIKGNAADYTIKATSSGVVIQSKTDKQFKVNITLDKAVKGNNFDAGEVKVLFADGELDLARGEVKGQYNTIFLGESTTALGKTAVDVTSVIPTEAPTEEPTEEPTDTPTEEPGAAQRLTTGQDDLTGTAGNDTFVARAIDNTNSFQSGDLIDGGAGRDTLEVTLGNSSAFAIAAETTSVEVVSVRSQALNFDGNTGENNVGTERNVIDAQDMQGVQEWWNTDSRADLVIEDIRIADGQITKDITIGLRNTDPSSVDANGKVDFEVYFSPESLRKEAPISSNSISLTVGNQLEAALGWSAERPLDNIPYDQVRFMVNGVEKTLTLDLTAVETYDQMFAALSSALEAAQAEDSDLAGITLGRVVAGDTFVARDGSTRTADVYTLTIEQGELQPALVGWNASAGLPSNNAFSATVEEGASSETNPLITSTIILDNVGRESEAGDLVVGGMSTRTGVEKFDITVENNSNTSGAYTASGSWLGNMRSTNNVLQEVVVRNAAEGIESPDYLYVGTGMDQAGNNLTTLRDMPDLLNTDGLTDVRRFDASEMQGDVKVGARITRNSIEKYQDLVDTAAEHGADDVEFTYVTGAGNDSVNLAIDAFAFASSSNIVVGRHDFTFAVNTGAGNDHIQVDITGWQNGQQNWYDNQAINNNIVIDGGAGDDVIRTPGAGNATIFGGAGNDTIYTDNTGFRASWMFNSTTDGSFADVFDRESMPATSVQAVNAQLTVTFRGISVTVPVADSVGKLSNVTITDLHINQAIKDAINSDPVLSKLLVAEDGAGRTLIVRSLIDGAVDMLGADGALTVALSTAVPTTAQLNLAAGTVNFFGDGTGAFSAADLDRYQAVDKVVFGGSNSWNISDNVINGGSGDDVIVLGTNADDIAGVQADLAAAEGILTLAQDSLALAETDLATAVADRDAIDPVADPAGWAAADAAVTAAQAAVTAAEADVTTAEADVTTAEATFVTAAADGVRASSNDTVVFEANFGDDVVVNFEAYVDATSVGADVLDFTALGGDINDALSNFGAGAISAEDKSISVVVTAGTVAADETAIKGALFAAANTVAETHVVVVTNADNIGSVYSVVDGVGAADTLTLVGTIDLADTQWADLTAANFA